MSKLCFFIGHRETGEEIYPALVRAVQQHIVEYGVTEFVVGQYGGFDRLAIRCVCEMKQRYPNLRLWILCPYHPAERTIVLPAGADGTYYPEGMETVPKRAAIVRANRIMVKKANYLIACVWHPASNARNLLDYARKREAKGEIRIENLSGK